MLAAPSLVRQGCLRQTHIAALVWRGNGHKCRFERADCDLDNLLVTDSKGHATTLAGLLDETYTDGETALE